MKVIITAIGTMGNALPFLGWALALQKRGHDVVVIGSPYLEPTVRRLGLTQFGPADSLDESTRHRGDNRPRRTLALLRQLVDEVEPLSRNVYGQICKHHEPGRTVVIATNWQFGARIASETLRVPLVTASLQPMLMPKHHPRRIGRAAHGLVRRVVNRRLESPLNRIRNEVGLRPLRGELDVWSFSPDLVVGLFPRWFCDYDRAWPAQVLLTDFPYFDRWEPAARPEELASFLASGEPPLVISESTLASRRAADNPFDLAIRAVQKLGRRAILLSSDPGRVPTSLPQGIGYFGFVPLSELLPKVAGFVHHGGMGSLSQGLIAGVPQLTVPRFMDQPDNAGRLAKCGASINLSPRGLTTERLAASIDRLLNDGEYRRRSQELAAVARTHPPFSGACAAVEHVGRLYDVKG